MKNAEVIRISKKIGDYTCVNNEHIFDTSISELASRVLSVALAVSDKYGFSIQGMATTLGRGVKAIKKALAELVQAGYACLTEQTRDEETGFFRKKVYSFYESPKVNPHHQDYDESLVESKNEIPENRDFKPCPKTVQPSGNDRNDQLSNTKLSNTKLLNQSVNANSNSTVETIVENLTDGLNVKKPDKPMHFSLMLYQMQCPDYDAYPEYHNEKDYANFDMEERCVQECTIPNSFRNNQATMEQALQYLFCHSQLEEGEYKNFESAVITCLSEAIHTGKLSFTNSVNSYAIIAKLNEINHSENYSLIEWMQDFAEKYNQEMNHKAILGAKIRNRHNYLKTCVVNYLKEYQSYDITPGFRLKKEKWRKS